LSLLNDVLFSIVSAKASSVYEAAVTEALARLTVTIRNHNANELWVVSSALEPAGSLARGALEACLGEGFFAAVVPPVFDCMRVVEDRDVSRVRICSYPPVLNFLIQGSRSASYY
jgi:hypothetical protein